MIGEIIQMNVEIPVMRNSWGVVAAKERNELNSSRNAENGLETADDEGGR